MAEILKQEYLRGDIYMADLGKTTGSEQGGIRPVLIIQNNVGNRFSPTVVVATMTSKQHKNPLPTHVDIKAEEYDNLLKDSVILAEQVATIDKSKLLRKVDTINSDDMLKVETAILISLGFGTTYIVNNKNNRNSEIKRNNKKRQYA